MQLAKSIKEENADGSRVKDLVGSVVNLAGSVVSDSYRDTFSDKTKEHRLKKLESLHKLQGSIVKQNMHNAMSPISAISGYLELINMSLFDDPDVEQIEYYRKKIESGVNEVNNIIEQLQQIYAQEMAASSEENEEMIEVDLNWMIQEVSDQMHFSNTNIEINRNAAPLHVKTDLFIAKLIIFNLINYAAKSSSKGQLIELNSNIEQDAATLSIVFNTSDKKVHDLAHIFQFSGQKAAISEVEQNSFNEGLINSIKLAKEIYSGISFLKTENEVVMLKLTMPLAG